MISSTKHYVDSCVQTSPIVSPRLPVLDIEYADNMNEHACRQTSVSNSTLDNTLENNGANMLGACTEEIHVDPPQAQSNYGQLGYKRNRPSDLGGTALVNPALQSRIVSLPTNFAIDDLSEQLACTAITGSRSVSMPAACRHFASLDKNESGNSSGDSFCDLANESGDICSQAIYRSPDLPRTPSPPSTPESVEIIEDSCRLPDTFLQRRQRTKNEIKTGDEDYIPLASSPPRPIPALHGPSSLPYARCPSGAEGTVIEEPSVVPGLIWGLDEDISSGMLGPSTSCDVIHDPVNYGLASSGTRNRRRGSVRKAFQEIQVNSGFGECLHPHIKHESTHLHQFVPKTPSLYRNEAADHHHSQVTSALEYCTDKESLAADFEPWLELRDTAGMNNNLKSRSNLTDLDDSSINPLWQDDLHSMALNQSTLQKAAPPGYSQGLCAQKRGSNLSATAPSFFPAYKENLHEQIRTNPKGSVTPYSRHDRDSNHDHSVNMSCASDFNLEGHYLAESPEILGTRRPRTLHNKAILLPAPTGKNYAPTVQRGLNLYALTYGSDEYNEQEQLFEQYKSLQTSLAMAHSNTDPASVGLRLHLSPMVYACSGGELISPQLRPSMPIYLQDLLSLNAAAKHNPISNISEPVPTFSTSTFVQTLPPYPLENAYPSPVSPSNEFEDNCDTSTNRSRLRNASLGRLRKTRLPSVPEEISGTSVSSSEGFYPTGRKTSGSSDRSGKSSAVSKTSPSVNILSPSSDIDSLTTQSLQGTKAKNRMPKSKIRSYPNNNGSCGASSESKNISYEKMKSKTSSGSLVHVNKKVKTKQYKPKNGKKDTTIPNQSSLR